MRVTGSGARTYGCKGSGQGTIAQTQCWQVQRLLRKWNAFWSTSRVFGRGIRRKRSEVPKGPKFWPRSRTYEVEARKAPFRMRKVILQDANSKSVAANSDGTCSVHCGQGIHLVLCSLDERLITAREWSREMITAPGGRRDVGNSERKAFLCRGAIATGS
jgi:hypothetical protein